MKTFYFGCLGVVLCLMAGSCFSAPPVNATTMNIPNPDATIAAFTPDTYKILGRVSGTGTVSFNSKTGTWSGDTFKYGSLGEIGSLGHVQNVTKKGLFGLSLGTTTEVVTPSNSREMAIGNATYELIEKARAMNADAIIFVTTSIEASGDAKSSTTTTKAVVNGIAIQLNQ